MEADRMDLVEIGHRSVPLRDIAQLRNGRDIAVHRIDRFETDQLWPARVGRGEHRFEMTGVVVTEDVLFGSAVPNALDHRGVIVGIRVHDAARHFLSQCGQHRLVAT
jgi:hypothetical protein